MLRQRRSTRPTKKRISWSLSPGPPELEHKVTTASKKESQKERGIDTLPSHDLTDACLRRNQRASRLGNGRGVAEGRESGKEGTKMRTVQSELHPSLHRSSNVCSSNGHKKQAHEQKALQQMMSEGKRSGGQILAESCADGDVCDNGKKKRKASSEEKGLLEKLSTRAKLPGVPVPASFISSGDECIQVAAVMGKRQHSTVAQSLRTSNDEHVSGMRKGNSEDTEQHNLVPRGIAERCFGVGSVVDASAASNTRSSNRTHMDGSNAIPEAERVGILPGTCRDAEVNMRLAGPDSHLGGQEDHNGLTTPPGQGNEQQEEPTVSVPQLLGHPGVEARSSSPLTLEGEPHGQLTECSSPRAICHAQVPLRTEEGEVEVVHDSLKTPPPVCDMDNFCGGSACTTSARRTPQLTQKRLQHLATETLRRLQQRQRTEHKAKVQDASCQATPRARQFEEAYTAFEERKKRRPCWQEVPLAGVHPKALIGRRCKIYWPLDKDWYPGVIYSYNHHNNKHRVDYADDENEWLLLSRERVQLSMRPGEMLPRLGREGVAGDPAAAGGDADADVDTDTDTAQQQQGLGLRKRGCDGGGGGGGGAYTAASDGGIIRGAGNNNNNNCGRARARTSGGGGGSSSRSISLRRSPELEVGSVVWGKVKGFPAWPAVVLAEEDCNQIVMESGPQQGIPVQFFGSFDFCRFRLKQLTPFMKGVKQQRLHTKCSKLVFLEGLQQARRYMQYQELPLAMQATRRDDDDDDDDESVAADGGDGNTGTPPTAQGDEENYDNDNSPPVVSSSYRPVTVDYGDKCRVCFLVDEWPDNLLLQCDRCHVMAHMHCCGEESSPDGDLWLCNLCRPGAPKHTPICCLCPVAGGVLKKTTDGRWAHNTCTMWIPDVYHVDDQHVSVESVPKERRDLLCSICKVDYGACIQCAYKRCFVAYHPLCAMNRGYVMEFEERRVETKSKSGQAKAKARQQERQQHQNNNNNNNKEEEEEEGREAAAACVVAEEEQEQEGRRTRRSRRVRGSEEGERAQQHHPGERQALKELPPDRVAAGEGGGAKRLLLLSDKEKKTRKNKRKREEEAVAVEMDTAAATATAYAGPTHSNGHVHGKAGEEEEEEAATATATARAPDAQQQGPGAEPEEGTPAAATAVEYIWNSWCSKHKPARKAGLAALSPRGNSTNNNNDDDDIARKKKKSAGSSAKGEAERGGGGGTQGEHPSSSSLQRTGLLGAEGAVATDGVGGRERGNSCLISYQPPETNPYSGCARSEPYKWLRRGRKEPEAVAAGLAKRNFVENVPYVVGGMGGGGGRTSKHRPQSYDPNQLRRSLWAYHWSDADDEVLGQARPRRSRLLRRSREEEEEEEEGDEDEDNKEEGGGQQQEGAEEGGAHKARRRRGGREEEEKVGPGSAAAVKKETKDDDDDDDDDGKGVGERGSIRADAAAASSGGGRGGGACMTAPAANARGGCARSSSPAAVAATVVARPLLVLRSASERVRLMRSTLSQRLTFGKSAIHGWGLFTKQRHRQGDMMIEYAGETVRQVVADMREQRKYDSMVGAGTYLFRIDAERVVDATSSGSLAHLINHACDPNCYSRTIAANGDDHIIIFAKRDLEEGEELTYDYRFKSSDERLKCNCGCTRCRGFVNVPDDEDEEEDAVAAAEETGNDIRFRVPLSKLQPVDLSAWHSRKAAQGGQ